MRILATAICSALLLICFVSGQESDLNPSQIVVRMDWSQIQQTHNGITADKCVIVSPSGHIHIETRVEHMPVPRASLQIYDGALTDDQLARLQDLLNSRLVRNLPEFVPFGIPGSIEERQSFTLAIARDGTIQRVGYAQWKASTENGTARAKLETLARTQEAPKAALQPLLRWLQALDTHRFVLSNNTSNFCSADE